MTPSIDRATVEMHTGGRSHAEMVGGRYRLDALLGRGGMADVYRARDVMQDRDVAIKLFRRGTDLVVDADRRRRHELDLLVALDDPGVVGLLDADVSRSGDRADASYIVLELVEGPTMAEELRTGPLAEEDVVALGAAMCRTLAHVHGRGIVHRDIKPANILLATGPEPGRHCPRLTDFGIALFVDSTRMTAEGCTVGTANYLSPEQVLAEPIGPASDIYSLGLVLIEALTACVAYPGHGVEAALARLHRKPAVPDGIDPRLAAVLTAMTHADPALRIDAREAAARLGGIADPMSPTGHSDRRHGAASTLARRVVVTATLAAAGAGTVLLLGGAGSAPTDIPAAPRVAVPSTTGLAPAAPHSVPARAVTEHGTPTSPVIEFRSAAPAPAPRRAATAHGRSSKARSAPGGASAGHHKPKPRHTRVGPG